MYSVCTCICMYMCMYYDVLCTRMTLRMPVRLVMAHAIRMKHSTREITVNRNSRFTSHLKGENKKRTPSATTRRRDDDETRSAPADTARRQHARSASGAPRARNELQSKLPSVRSRLSLCEVCRGEMVRNLIHADIFWQCS